MEMLGFPTEQQEIVVLELELTQLVFSFQMVTDYHRFDLSDILAQRQMLRLEKTWEWEIAFTVLNKPR